MAAVTDLPTQLKVVGVILLGLGVVHLALPLALGWSHELIGASQLNREVSYVHCYFIGLSCTLWGLLPLASGTALLERNPVTRMVLIGAIAFWASRLVIQLAVFNRHARESKSWCLLSLAGTGLWLYITLVWAWALAAQT